MRVGDTGLRSTTTSPPLASTRQTFTSELTLSTFYQSIFYPISVLYRFSSSFAMLEGGGGGEENDGEDSFVQVSTTDIERDIAVINKEFQAM